jgi:hypothetical protein
MRFSRLSVRLLLGSMIVSAFVIVSGTALAESAEEAPPNGQLVGRSLEGRPIYCQVFGEGEDVLWILATIHGNEAAGTPLVAKFVEWLEKNPKELEGRQVVIVPVANPDGFAANIRHNKNDVDLNRNFPAGNFDAEVKTYGSTPLSEPESRALMRVLMQYFPDRIIVWIGTATHRSHWPGRWRPSASCRRSAWAAGRVRSGRSWG